MKGGGQNYRWDVRLRWTCPECGAIRKTPGSVTSQVCGCQGAGVQMNLVGLPPHGFPNSPDSIRTLVSNVHRTDSSPAEAAIVEGATARSPVPTDSQTEEN